MRENHSDYDEANTRMYFIEKFLELPGWDVFNIQQFFGERWEVVREDKGTIEGKPKDGIHGSC